MIDYLVFKSTSAREALSAKGLMTSFLKARQRSEAFLGNGRII